MQLSFTFENIGLQNKMSEFKTILLQKSFDFNENEKEKTGFYYLLNLIERSKYLNFKNASDFIFRFRFLVNEFLVPNKGKVNLGSYFTYFENFKRYIRKEFDLVPEKYYRNNLLLIFFILTIIGAFFTSGFLLIFLPITLFMEFLIGIINDNNEKKIVSY